MRKYNELQRRLRNFFPHHKLFMLGQPVADRVLAQMEVLRDDQLQPQFRQQEEAFCQHIWKEAPVKVLLNSSQVTGRVLARLAETYMAAITTGSVPCVESALTVVVEAENSTAVEAAVAEYRQGMEQGLVLPTASHDALMAVHRDWKQRAGTFFLSHAFANTRQCYQALLMDKLEAAKEEFCRRNEEASEQRCCAVLRELWGDTELRMKRGDYVVPGGMRLFQEDLKRVLEEYERRPDKGVKAEAVLKEFLRVKGLEMMEMWLDWVDQQCKAVLAEVAAATQTVEKKLEKQLEKQLEEQLEEHRQQQRAELTKMRMVKEKVEQRICILEKQQEAMLAEVAAIKKMVEKQLEQQQVVLAEVTAAKKAVEKQQEQQQVALAEVTALQEAAEAQLEERWQRWAQQLQEEQNLVLSQRLQELEARLQEGRGCEAAALQQMQEEDQTVPSWRSTLLKFLDKVVVPILIRLVNSVVNNAA